MSVYYQKTFVFCVGDIIRLLASVFESTYVNSQLEVENTIAVLSWIPAWCLSLIFGISRAFRKKWSHGFIVTKGPSGSFCTCLQNTICQIYTSRDAVMSKSVHR